MTLPDFIEANLEDLIDDWTAFARELSPKGNHFTEEQLSDAARELLTAIANDMRLPQNASQQQEKAHGNRPDPDSAFNQLGRGHADDRQSHGFEINALIGEYRALRASVLKRWQATCELDSSALQEMIRFNEAIDQMIAESVRQFSKRSERIRDLFAGVLAHDLRSPLGAIVNSTRVMLRDENLSSTGQRAGATLQRSAERMKILVDDLFAFTRTRLGSSLPIEPTPQQFDHLCHVAIDEVRAANPNASIDVRMSGELSGYWDAGRVNQLIVNLLTNAVRYGTGGIRLEAESDGEQIVLAVANAGSPIPARALPTLFDPLTRAPAREKVPSGVGLGLYICRVIAEGHKGKISVESNQETVFTVHLPRFPPPNVDDVGTGLTDE